MAERNPQEKERHPGSTLRDWSRPSTGRDILKYRSNGSPGKPTNTHHDYPLHYR
ncbi:MAG: hypothetical protein HC795_07650 [Coleofasciculaceae cyanobacterium RL_1_1]|nr:hypothetical protein [Coleofasciculaceae cyanobacterium RL_1_1]